MSPPTEDTTMPNMIRIAVTVATLAVVSSIPAAGQAPKLSPQQFNPPTLNVNRPIAAPNKPITVLRSPTVATFPNGNKPIAAPKTPTASLTASRVNYEI